MWTRIPFKSIYLSLLFSQVFMLKELKHIEIRFFSCKGIMRKSSLNDALFSQYDKLKTKHGYL